MGDFYFWLAVCGLAGGIAAGLFCRVPVWKSAATAALALLAGFTPWWFNLPEPLAFFAASLLAV